MYKVFSVQAIYPEMVKEYKQAKNKLYATYLSNHYQFCNGNKKKKMIAINVESKHCPILFDPLYVQEYCSQIIDSLNKVKLPAKKKRKSKKNPNPKQVDRPLLGNLQYYRYSIFAHNGSKILQILAATDDLENPMIFNSELK